MTKRYDVAQPRTYQDRNGGGEKTSWQNLGVAFEKDGKISILLNALPMPGPDGQAKLILMEPRDDRGGQQRGREDRTYGQDRRTAAQAHQETRSVADLDDLSDDVPF